MYPVCAIRGQKDNAKYPIQNRVSQKRGLKIIHNEVCVKISSSLTHEQSEFQNNKSKRRVERQYLKR